MRMNPIASLSRRRSRSLTSKILLTTATLGAAASIAGLGTFATFTSSTSASQSVASGTLTLTLGATGASTNRLDVGATAMAAGDTLQRSFDLTYAGTVAFSAVSLTSAASPSSLLDTDAVNGLQMVIDRCSVAWTESAPPYTYTCGGSTSSVITSQPVIGTDVAMSNLTLTAASTDHLRLTLTLPGG